MSERNLVTKIEKFLKRVKGLWYYKASDKFTAGVPDLVICHKGKFIGIEVKEKGVLSEIQKYVGSKICEARGKWAVCRSIEEVKEVLNV